MVETPEALQFATQKAIIQAFNAGKATQEQAIIRLKEFSPLELQPCVIFSEQHGYLVAQKLSNTGNAGTRLLVRQENWKLLRIKKTSKIYNLTQKEFEELVILQEKYYKFLMQYIPQENNYGKDLQFYEELPDKQDKQNQQVQVSSP